MDKYPQELIMDGSNSTSCCVCHRFMHKSVQKVGIFNAKMGQGLLGVVSYIHDLWHMYHGYQGHQTGEVLSVTNIVGP